MTQETSNQGSLGTKIIIVASITAPQGFVVTFNSDDKVIFEATHPTPVASFMLSAGGLPIAVPNAQAERAKMVLSTLYATEEDDMLNLIFQRYIVSKIPENISMSVTLITGRTAKYVNCLPINQPNDPFILSASGRVESNTWEFAGIRLP